MKKSKWMKPICDDQMMGINMAIIKEIRRSCQSVRVIGNEAFVKTDLIIHGYREVGTALEVSVEAHWKIPGLPTTIKFANIVI